MTTRSMPALLIAMALPAWVHSASQVQGRFPLTPHQVAQTLSVNGIQAEDRQVTMLASVVAAEAAPVLDILSIEPLGNRSPGKRGDSRSGDARFLVKLGCREPGLCLPFYSIVRTPEASAESQSAALRVSSGTDNAVRRTNSGIVIRVGAHATLVMDDARAHVEVAVVSLENGCAGHKIHVASPDHKQVYLAEVVSANLLKRSF
ncbi:MAG: hypothetical protein ABSB60_09735 [Terracidiphilus sp.]